MSLSQKTVAQANIGAQARRLEVCSRVPESLPSYAGADRQRNARVASGGCISACRARPDQRLSGGPGAAPPEDASTAQNDKLLDAWREFLSRYPWSWFGTFTFAREVHPEAADKRYRVWASKLSRSLYGTRWYKRQSGVYWIRALEMQRRGVIHYHALVGAARLARADDRLALANRRVWEAEWLEIGRGFARLETPRSIGSVSGYCAKYVAKGGEIDLGGMFPDLTSLPLLVSGDCRPP